MIGFITSPAIAQIILDSIQAAQESRGLPYYWSTGSYPIFTGEYAGQVFLPFDDEILSVNLRGGMTPMDFPEAQQLIDGLGGLEARIDLAQQFIVDPNIQL
tara:strand:+ start:1596 stop:1898 length:303 start_codon:yes stop_codon:yes gene_type:complete